ncbi:MAG: hypothetical protein DCC58_04305 [Chloroflexi bacterium]|nr:MAG: hypothetical protein DCC58_04305 [Chloroflexota bacterium]
MLADIARFHLPPFGVAGGVGEDAALEGLHQHLLLDAAHLDGCPVGFGNRVSGGIERVEEERVLCEGPIFPHDASRVHELPEDRSNRVLGVGNVIGSRHPTGREGGVDRDSPVAVDAPIHRRAGRQGCVVQERAEGGICRDVRVVRVACDIDLGRLVHDEQVVANLHTASDQLSGEQTVRDEPGAIRRDTLVGRDLHARLVVVLHEATVVVPFEVLLEHPLGVGFRAPHPGAAHRTIGNRFVGARPGVLERLAIRRHRLCAHHRQQQQRDGHQHRNDVCRPHRSPRPICESNNAHLSPLHSYAVRTRQGNGSTIAPPLSPVGIPTCSTPDGRVG